MKKKDLEHFAKRLKEDKARILNHNEKIISEDLKLASEDLADEVDLASSELNQSLSLRLRDRERLLLQKIETALGKIETGTYGVCEGCEDSIESKRLEVRPTAEMCIRCKEAEERKEKIFA